MKDIKGERELWGEENEIFGDEEEREATEYE